jgi:hypothetical protein
VLVFLLVMRGCHHEMVPGNTSDIFWRKGLTNEATNWLNVGIASHFHLNR